MKRSLVVGRTNVGKTLFCIRFAKYLGLRELQWFVERTDGKTEQVKMSLQEAERVLSDKGPHRTRNLQSVRIQVPRGKVDREMLLTDTTGLSDGVHPEETVRSAMAQTLEAMLSAGMILHIVDAAEVGEYLQPGQTGLPPRSWSTLDEQISEYGRTISNYFVLANKIDLPAAKQGYKQLCKHFSKQRVLPVSALEGTGFREVRQHVWHLA